MDLKIRSDSRRFVKGKKIESYLEVFRVKFCHTPRGWSPPADEAVIRKFWRPKGLRVEKRSEKSITNISKGQTQLSVGIRKG